MEFTANFAGIFKDWQSGRMRVSFDTDQLSVVQAFDKLDGDLIVTVGKQKKKRSLDANAYFHKLVQLLAEDQSVSLQYMKNRLIGSYGQPAVDDDGHGVVFSIEARKDRQVEESSDVHLVPIGRGFVGEKEFTHWQLMRGTHTYNTAEMSRLIKGAITECEACGIDASTPDELARLLQLGGSNEI